MAKISGPARTSNTSSSPTWPSRVSPENSASVMPSVRSGPEGAVFSSAMIRLQLPSSSNRDPCRGVPAKGQHMPALAHRTSAGLASRQLPVRPHEVAGVAVGNPFEVILMLGFGLPEISNRDHFRGRLAGPDAGGVDV